MPLHRTLVAVACLFVGCQADAPLTFDTAVDSDEVESGDVLYAVHCAECHDDDGRGTSEGPDLTVRVDTLTPAEVATVVVRGDGRMDPVDVSNDEAFVVSVWVVENFGEQSR